MLYFYATYTSSIVLSAKKFVNLYMKFINEYLHVYLVTFKWQETNNVLQNPRKQIKLNSKSFFTIYPTLGRRRLDG